MMQNDARDMLIIELEEELVEWLNGEKSYTNMLMRGAHTETGNTEYQIAMADNAKVQALSTAIIALRGGLELR